MTTTRPPSKTLRTTFASFRRRIRKGTVIEIIGHNHLASETGRYVVQEARTTGFTCFSDARATMYDWPQANRVIVDGPDSIVICQSGHVRLMTIAITKDSSET